MEKRSHQQQSSCTAMNGEDGQNPIPTMEKKFFRLSPVAKSKPLLLFVGGECRTDPQKACDSAPFRYRLFNTMFRFFQQHLRPKPWLQLRTLGSLSPCSASSKRHRDLPTRWKKNSQRGIFNRGKVIGADHENDGKLRYYRRVWTS